METEMTDDEFRTITFNSGSYDFWNDEADDVYTANDGVPVGVKHNCEKKDSTPR